MPYIPFNETTPEPAQEGPEVLASTRENLAALRDDVVKGNATGWNMQTQDSDGSSPPSVPSQPEQLLYSKGVLRIRLSLTWGTVGGEAGNVTQVFQEFSVNSGALYEPMITPDAPSGIKTISYHADGTPLSTNWS